MARFRGNNSISSPSRIGFERAKYNSQAFDQDFGDDPEQVVDFNFAEKSMYGKVDVNHNPIYPNEDFIVPITTANNSVNTITVQNYVAEQFRDLELHFVKACRSGLIPTNDPVLSVLTAHRGYENPKQHYINYSNSLMNTYVQDFLNDRDSQIRSFEDFLFYLTEFTKRMRHVYPMTFSGFMRSAQGSIFSSGLTIDIGGLSFDNDIAKETQLLDSPAFNYYINLAKQYGFSVNKRNPGVLISDVSSPQTLVYRKKFNLSTGESIFSKQFNKTLHDDVGMLTTLIVDGYESYIFQYPFNVDIKTCGDKVIKETTFKKYINNINKYYNNIIKLYINIRNLEENNPYSDKEIENIYNKSIRLRIKSDEYMMKYIEDTFQSKYNINDGTLTYYKKRYKNSLTNPSS
jgi:hypothetical protein